MLAAIPDLYLYPLNADSFVKHMNLTNNQCVKIGWQTNARTVPAENNGYSDSEVLNQHAEVWEENTKVHYYYYYYYYYYYTSLWYIDCFGM